jgi:hypothetical protein
LGEINHIDAESTESAGIARRWYEDFMSGISDVERNAHLSRTIMAIISGVFIMLLVAIWVSVGRMREEPAAEDRSPKSLRVTTVVWGLALAAASVTVLVMRCLAVEALMKRSRDITAGITIGCLNIAYIAGVLMNDGVGA